MNASEARKLSEARNKDKSKNGIQTILDFIKEDPSQYKVTVSVGLVRGVPDIIVKELEALGYKAEYVCDWRDGDYYKVTW